MTEAEWGLRVLGNRSNKPSDRKLRLLSSACCRRIWERFDDRSRYAVALAERVADGLADLVELAQYRQEAQWALRATSRKVVQRPSSALEVACRLCAPPPLECRDAYGVAESCSDLDWEDDESCSELDPFSHERADEDHIQLARDIFGDHDHSYTVDPAWRTWNNGTVVRLAEAIYEERELPSGHLDAGRLAILADALEDAGCTNADMLAHCRRPGPHVRGCWVIDLLVGKQ